MTPTSVLKHPGVGSFLAALLASGFVSPPVAAAQDETEVVAVVERFFEAMATGDTILGANTLVMQGQFANVRKTPEGTRVGTTSHTEFLGVIGRGEQKLLERMWDPTVMVHGRVAMVWAPYDFHIDGAFSHCGVDVFSLVKTDEGWRIAGVTFTVEREDCPESPLGPPGG